MAAGKIIDRLDDRRRLPEVAAPARAAPTDPQHYRPVRLAALRLAWQVRGFFSGGQAARLWNTAAPDRGAAHQGLLALGIPGMHPGGGYCLDLGRREFLVHVILHRDQPLAVLY